LAKGERQKAARKVGKPRAKKALLEAWKAHHLGVETDVAAAMQLAEDAGVSEEEMNRVMNRAARETEKVRERQYRTGERARKHLRGSNPLTVGERARMKVGALPPKKARAALKREREALGEHVGRARSLGESIEACRRCEPGAERKAKAELVKAKKALKDVEKLARYSYDDDIADQTMKRLRESIAAAETELSGTKHKRGDNPKTVGEQHYEIEPSTINDDVLTVKTSGLRVGDKMGPPTWVGTIDTVKGTINVWSPVGYKPRGYGKVAKQVLEDVREELRKQGKLSAGAHKKMGYGSFGIFHAEVLKAVMREKGLGYTHRQASDLLDKHRDIVKMHWSLGHKPEALAHSLLHREKGTAHKAGDNPRTRPRGIYSEMAHVEARDYVLHYREGKVPRWSIDRVGAGGTHTTIGPTRGYSSIAAVEEGIGRDAHSRAVSNATIHDASGEILGKLVYGKVEWDSGALSIYPAGAVAAGRRHERGDNPLTRSELQKVKRVEAKVKKKVKRERTKKKKAMKKALAKAKGNLRDEKLKARLKGLIGRA
jgi:hypothetical protein